MSSDVDWAPSGSEYSSETMRFEHLNASVYPVMVVDDNEGVCILISRMLSNIGFRSIYVANSAKQAYQIFSGQLALLEKDPIVFLDLRLPDVSGENVARKIIEIRPTSKIILVTAEDSSAESVQGAIKEGACAYIQKPIGLSKIRNVLAEVLEDLERKRSQKELLEQSGDGLGSRS